MSTRKVLNQSHDLFRGKPLEMLGTVLFIWLSLDWRLSPAYMVMLTHFRGSCVQTAALLVNLLISGYTECTGETSSLNVQIFTEQILEIQYTWKKCFAWLGHLLTCTSRIILNIKPSLVFFLSLQEIMPLKAAEGHEDFYYSPIHDLWKQQRSILYCNRRGLWGFVHVLMDSLEDAP